MFGRKKKEYKGYGTPAEQAETSKRVDSLIEESNLKSFKNPDNLFLGRLQVPGGSKNSFINVFLKISTSQVALVMGNSDSSEALFYFGRRLEDNGDQKFLEAYEKDLEK